MTFTEYLKYKEGVISKTNYYSFLETLPREGRIKVICIIEKNIDIIFMISHNHNMNS